MDILSDRILFVENKVMEISEWILLIAIIDGPLLGLFYFIWRKFKQ